MLHYYAKHFYAPFAVSGYIEAGNATIYAVNDAQTSVLGSLVLEVVNWKTGPVATSTFSATAPSAGSAQVCRGFSWQWRLRQVVVSVIDALAL